MYCSARKHISYYSVLKGPKWGIFCSFHCIIGVLEVIYSREKRNSADNLPYLCLLCYGLQCKDKRQLMFAVFIYLVVFLPPYMRWSLHHFGSLQKVLMMSLAIKVSLAPSSSGNQEGTFPITAARGETDSSDLPALCGLWNKTTGSQQNKPQPLLISSAASFWYIMAPSWIWTGNGGGYSVSSLSVCIDR